jgi:isopenicillin N synthase-like dioxygenase
MLSRYTNNKLKSTIHQVVNPPRELWNFVIQSVPFYAPCQRIPLNSLENCIDTIQNNLKITAGDYLYERLVDLGLIKNNP